MVLSLIGAAKADLDTPALCLDIEAVQRNIQRMADYFRDSPVRLRPHSKTHKSPMLARMQLDAGAIGITCAKLGEAETMAQAGIRNILIANEVIGPGKIARLVNLAAYTEVIVAVDNAANAADLSAAAAAKGIRLRVLIELDIGHGRCGVLPGRPALELARAVSAAPGLTLAGLMGYEGHSIMTPDPAERRAQTEASLALLTATADLLRAEGIPVEIVSSGGTGTYFITGKYPGVTELEAGSYITMDRQYREVIGIDFEYGLTVLATVVHVRGSDHAICDAGLKALTRDFGMPLVIDPPGWELTGLSEEHGHLKRVDGPPLQVGAKIEIVPNHGCTTINLYNTYHVLRNGVLEALWPVAARGRTD